LEPIRINCGGDTYFDIEGNTWVSDTDFVTGGGTWSTSAGNIVGTQDDELYFTERNGECQFDIHLPTGNYVIKLHFAEIYHNSPGKRVFDVVVGQTFFPGLDVVAFGGGVPKKAVTLEFVETIVSGTPLQIKLIDGPIDMPKILAIEIELNGPHLAHAVTGGPYFGVDIDGDGYAVVPVDGSQSHTHAENMNLISFVWKSGGQTLGTGVATSLMLPEGENTVMLTVVDNGGNESTDTTTITVQPEGYPTVSSISPNTGPIAGNTQVTITGAGFTDPSSQTTVHFGGVQLTGAALDIKNSSTIIVSSPPIGVGVPVLVSVATLTGESNSLSFTYVGDVAIEFSRQTLIGFTKPSAVAFGPDSKLYVANTDGKIGKFTLNETFDEVVDSVISSTLENGDAILGMAFDPMDTSANPTLYVSRSELFHGEWKSSFGKAINGKIWVVSGANLDTAVPVITGLPVSDHDHATNGLEFGDKGELYIQVGGNTNGGIPGGLTNGKQEENYFSAATLVAYMGNSTFDGTLLYDDNGNPVGGNGVQVFAAGFRNPYGITLRKSPHAYLCDFTLCHHSAHMCSLASALL
jgi:glucose/arabinose dehydrogenase